MWGICARSSLGLSCTVSVSILMLTAGGTAEPVVLSAFDPPLLFVYGEWQGRVSGGSREGPLDVTIERILLLSEQDDPRVVQAREARRAREEAERARAEEELAAARAAVRHTGQSPWIERCYTVAPDVLAVSIRAREIIPGHIEPYVPRPGDELRPREHRADLYRDGTFVAKVIGPDLDTLVFDDQITGDALLELLAGRADTWSLNSADDPHCSVPVAPVSVSRKSKPLNSQHGGWGARQLRHATHRLSAPAVAAVRGRTLHIGLLPHQPSQRGP